MLETWFFFRPSFNFQCQGAERRKKLHFIPINVLFSLLSSKTMGMLLSPYHPLCRRACMVSKKTKIFKSLNIRDI